MRRVIFRCLGAMAFWLFSAPAWAYQGVELGRDCRNTDEAAQARCEGYISGFLAGAQMDIEGEPINMWRSFGYTWCGPADVEVSDVVEALFAAALAGQATPHFPAPVMLAQSLSAAYPCAGTSVPRYPGLRVPLIQDE